MDHFSGLINTLSGEWIQTSETSFFSSLNENVPKCKKSVPVLGCWFTSVYSDGFVNLFGISAHDFDFEFKFETLSGSRWHKTETTLVVATTLRRRWMKRAYRDASRAEGTARRPGTAPQTVINSSCPSLLDLPSNRRNLTSPPPPPPPSQPHQLFPFSLL